MSGSPPNAMWYLETGGWFIDLQYLYNKPRAHWEADELVDECQTCLIPFNIFIRRHHCRNCGGIFCSECTSEKIKVVGYEHEERVCAICFDNVQSDIKFYKRRGGSDDIKIRWRLLVGRIAEGKARDGEIISRIYEGVPDTLRADLWLSLSKKTKVAATAKYSTLTAPIPQNEEKIQLDVTRTFPDNAMVQSERGQQALIHLLHALVAYFPSMGYSQHFAFVAGMVLIVMGWEREEDAFWVLAHLFDKAKGPLAPGRVDASVDYVRSALEASHPNLAEHLEAHRITLDVFVHRWLTTIFSYDLPLPFALVVWDLILTCGHLFGPALALAMLDHSREALVARDANGIVQYFNHLPPALFGKDTTLLDDAFIHWSHIRKR